MAKAFVECVYLCSGSTHVERSPGPPHGLMWGSVERVRTELRGRRCLRASRWPLLRVFSLGPGFLSLEAHAALFLAEARVLAEGIGFVSPSEQCLR